jgi:hypothetical protein
VSSNALKDSGRFRAEDLYPAAGIGWRAGLRGWTCTPTTAFGCTLIYPASNCRCGPRPRTKFG